jgi:hypothetical protein
LEAELTNKDKIIKQSQVNYEKDKAILNQKLEFLDLELKESKSKFSLDNFEDF